MPHNEVMLYFVFVPPLDPREFVMLNHVVTVSTDWIRQSRHSEIRKSSA